MLIKDLEMNFEVTYDYETKDQNILDSIAMQCSEKLLETLEGNMRSLEKWEECKVIEYSIDLSKYEASVVIDVEVDEDDLGVSGDDCIPIFKKRAIFVFERYISLERVYFEGEEDGIVITAKLVSLDK